MSTTDIAQKLLIGSREIDRMKEEIKSVISMAVGLIPGDISRWDQGFSKDDIEYHLRSATFDSPYCEWIIRPELGGLEIHCLLKDPNDPPTGKHDAYSWCQGSHYFLSRPDIWKVHAGLSVLVEGMIKTFPNLQRGLQPFLDAADHATKKA